ncbi:MAG: phosphoribosylformylglycinamidine synthase subunit PurQ [Planctomycetes bacterium]|nr:phosphoribosylformylglycinamidine synthase subunit PurQ [Planctomycetota bacterium]
MPNAIVIRAPGTNCDLEMCRAFSLAGAKVELVHLERLCAQPDMLDGFDLVGFPGGFSYGDDIASGRVYALKIRERVYGALRRAAERGVAMIGACNGFQVLVQAGLLPGPGRGEPWPLSAPPQVAALTDNQDARFHDRWVGVAFEASSPCVWTAGLAEEADEGLKRLIYQLPVAHGEGRFVTASPLVLESMEQGGQVALRYTDNYNGSQGAIAGICDASGRIFGLMPHPERFLEWNRHPYWTRLPAAVRKGETPGLKMFRSAVASVSGAAAK